MKSQEKRTKKFLDILHGQIIFYLYIILNSNIILFAQSSSPDPACYTPVWIRNGFADAGATHEPWLFQVRRNSDRFNQWQKENYDNQMSEDYIKSLATSGITVYHVSFYKGFGFKAEKENMDNVAKAAAIAHKYGLKVDTYIQWNTMCYETFFAEVPEAKKDMWYQVDCTGKPILLTYGYQQSFRYRPCFNHDGYMNYYKEKIIRYAVEVVKTDFIHFDNFDLNPPPDADHNPATIAAFRKYLIDKYSPSGRKERFGFEDVGYILPPVWNDQNRAEAMVTINDPAIQEWIDFRCWTMTTRLAECARFVRSLNKEVAIEVNPHGLIGSNRAWEAGINHPDLMQYTNVIWTEDSNNPGWENGIAIGKFRHYKLARTTNNFILTYNRTPQDFAENLALNRTMGFLGTGNLRGASKDYMKFWLDNKDVYTNCTGAEKVAVLRSYPSMAYNTRETHVAVNMAEQTLQQKQIPFDIIFDQQMSDLNKYYVIVLADQESLSDKVIAALKTFTVHGGGLVVTGNTGFHDNWRRLRQQDMLSEMISEKGVDLVGITKSESMEAKKNVYSFSYGKGRVIYIPDLIKPEGEIRLGFSTRWMVPQNSSELASAVFWAAGKTLPLQVSAPEWVGVSHDKQDNRDIIHLFNYKADSNVGGIIIRYDGTVKKAWTVSPDEDGKNELTFNEKGGITELIIPDLSVYKLVILETK